MLAVPGARDEGGSPVSPQPIQPQVQQQVQRRRRVVVCGSLAHPNRIAAAVAAEQAAGRTVIAWPSVNDGMDEDEAAAVWRAHIAAADEVLVVPKPDGCLGTATAAERDYAARLGRVVRTWSAPRRVQRSRRAGWRMPADAVYVGRPTRWGNPVPVGPGVGRAEAVRRYRVLLGADPGLRARARAELAGRDLVCWCPLDQPCHADVLLAAANEPAEVPT